MVDLSKNYFKKFDSELPVVQILQARSCESEVIRLRLLCSDGDNAYAQIGIAKKLEQLIINDRLYNAEKHSIIQILKMQKIGCAIIIEKYKILKDKSDVIGSPRSIFCECHGHLDNPALLEVQSTNFLLQRYEDAAIPLSFLTPYFALNWIVKAVVVEIESIREIPTKKGYCKYFTFIVKDAKEESDKKMRMKVFGIESFRFNEVLDVGKMYYFECPPRCIQEKYNPNEIAFYDYEVLLNDSCIVKRVL